MWGFKFLLCGLFGLGDVRGSKSRKPPVGVRGLSFDEDLGIAAEHAVDPEWCQRRAFAMDGLPRNHFYFANHGANLFGKCRKPVVGSARLLSLLKQALQIIDGRLRNVRLRGPSHQMWARSTHVFPKLAVRLQNVN